MRKKKGTTLIVILLAVVVGLGLSVKPWQMYRKQQTQANKSMAEMRESEAKKEELLKEESKKKSSLGQEEQARGAGYYGPGEVPASK